MSSFTSKQAQRAKKATKSFILLDEGKNLLNISTEQPNVVEADNVQESRSSPNSQTLIPIGSVEVNHLGLYLDLPEFLEIRRDHVKGRGVYAKKNLKRGTVIFAQRPSVISLSNSNLESHCSYCACVSNLEIPLKRCTKCKTLWYCSSKCQTEDWAIHKHECRAIIKWMDAAPDGNPPGEAVRTLGRILWGRKVQGSDSTWWKEIQTLQSHASSLPPSTVKPYTNLAHALVRYLGVTSPDELAPYGLSSAGDIVDLISKFTINTFTLTSPTLLPLGTCVSPIAALFNHSCRPNAVIVFPRSPKSSNSLLEPILHVIVIRDILPGEEVLTSYVDTTPPTKQRQDALKETYNFTCSCPVCSSTDKVAEPREIVLCPKNCGGLCPAPFTPKKGSEVIPWRCTSCKESYTSLAVDEVNDKRRLGQDALEKATKIQFSDSVYALKLASNMSSLLSPRLPPSAHPLLGLLRLQQSLLIESLSRALDPSPFLDDTIRVTARVVSGLTALLDEGHPIRGIALAELGKLLAVDEPSTTVASSSSASATTSTTPAFPPTGPQRLNLALETLKRALGELLIGFGESTKGGEAGMGVREEVVRLEKEMSVWREGIRNVWQDFASSERKT